MPIFRDVYLYVCVYIVQITTDSSEDKTLSLSCFSRVQLFAIPWTVPHPLTLGFSGQEYWSGLPFPPPGDLPDEGLEPKSPALTGRFFTTEPPGKPTSLADITLIK